MKKGRSSRLFNQSFYEKAPSQTGFEKIHHEDSVKKIDKAPADTGVGHNSPYRDDLTLDLDRDVSDSQNALRLNKKR